MPGICAFTAGVTRPDRILQTQIDIVSGRNRKSFPALWDTGATDSCISKEVAKDLKLISTGLIPVQTPSGQADFYTYLIDYIVLPNNLIVKNVKVCESEIGAQGFGMLIGMDIISMGDFAVSNYGGKSIFTFRLPSIGEIDFVKGGERA